VTRRPLFLLSLPRSGSTLVQRVLATHPEVATAPEPWLALPQLYAMRGAGVYAEYGYGPSTRAIREFAEGLPGGREAYDEELRSFLLRVYGRAAGTAAYFLDKTPRYDLVAGELLSLFPDARTIILWRNPLAVVSSIVETWAGGRWTFGRWKVDLHEGLDRLVTAAAEHAGHIHAVRFEDLVEQPDVSWPAVFGYLQLAYDPTVLRTFAETRLDARMGDPSGSRAYDELSTEANVRQRLPQGVGPSLPRLDRTGTARSDGLRPRATARRAGGGARRAPVPRLRRLARSIRPGHADPPGPRAAAPHQAGALVAPVRTARPPTRGRHCERRASD